MSDRTAPVLDVTQAPDGLAPTYARLALISHRRHLDALGSLDGQTLVVVTDWLLWQRCQERRLPALHYEHLLDHPIDQRGPVPDMVFRAIQWVCGEQGDMTRFLEVSLGQAFARQSVLIVQAYERLWHGLDRLCQRFRPAELLLYDLRGDFGLVSDQAKRVLAADLARRHGAVLHDRLDPVDSADPDFPNPPLFLPGRESWKKSLIRILYTRVIGLVFALRWWMLGRKPKVLMLLDYGQLAGMMRACPSRLSIAPVIDAGAVPKSWSFLSQAWRKGFVLAHMPAARLNAADHAALARMQDQVVGQARSRPLDQVVNQARIATALWFFQTGSAQANARLAKRLHTLFRRHHFSRIVCGDCDFSLGRIAAELARSRSVPVDETFNGIFLTDWRTPSRCGQGETPPLVSRLLAWGPWVRSWAAAIRSPVPLHVTGYPALQDVQASPTSAGPPRKVLILPPYSVEIDPAALTGRVGEFMTRIVPVLRRLGFDEIRVKIHPGHANLAWYRQVLDQAGFAHVPVLISGRMHDHASWADCVIGPPTTGAMAECLAAGRPFYPYVARPSAVSVGHMAFMHVAHDLEQLEQAMRAGAALYPDQVLTDLCGGNQGGRAIWDLLNGG